MLNHVTLLHQQSKCMVHLGSVQFQAWHKPVLNRCHRAVRRHCSSSQHHLQTGQEVLILEEVPLKFLLDAADVVAGVSFSDEDEGPPGSAIDVQLYKVQVALLMVSRQLLLGSRHRTVAVVPPSRSKAAAAKAGTRYVGVSEVTIQPLEQDAAMASDLRAGSAVAFVSNMAVRQGYRRRGIGRQLLRSCEAAARGAQPCPRAMALFVRKHNQAAMRLYMSEGYELKEWTDPDWLDAAYRGDVGSSRRLLMVKPLKRTAL